jgi:hypothetical protein
LSGPEINLTTITNLLSATFGQTFFAEDTLRTWMCVGSGTWACVSHSGIVPSGAGGYFPVLKLLTGMADNTNVNLCLVTIPNAIMGCILAFTVQGTQGDGDSTESSYWTCAVSRVAGANAKMLFSAKGNSAATVGVTSTVAATLSNTAVSGAVGAVNTFQIQAKVARSAGASTGHVLVASIEVLNGFASGCTVA